MAVLARITVLLGSFLLASFAAGQTSLIINGSFEQGPLPRSFIDVPGGSTLIKGWVVTGEGVDYVTRLWRASDGKASIDLDGSARSTKTPPYDRGGIAQTFSTVPGKHYQVTFDLAGNGYGPPAVKPMRVLAAGLQMDFTFDVRGKTPANMGWETKKWTFTANSTSTTLEFRSMTASPATGYGAVIDNVFVHEVDDASSK